MRLSINVGVELNTVEYPVWELAKENWVGGGHKRGAEGEGMERGCPSPQPTRVSGGRLNS